MERYYLIVFGSAVATSVLVTLAVRAISLKVGFLDRPGERKVHTEPVALGGGIAIAVGFGAAIVTALAGARVAEVKGLGPAIGEGLPAMFGRGAGLWTLVGAAGALAAVGLVDDVFTARARYKFAAQVAVAAFLVACGHTATLFLDSRLLGGVVTVIWIVGITNSFNLLDNMDGLSAGVAFIIGAIFFVVAIQTGQTAVAVVLLCLVGSVLGFLVFNFPPAKIFMGDCGSLFIGCVLAVCAIDFSFISQEVAPSRAYLPFAAPLLLFAIPIYDTASVLYIRLREGRHPFHPDKKHFSHRLVDLGMTKRVAVLTIYLAALALGLSATLLRFLDRRGMVVAVVQAIALVSVIVMLERTGRARR